MKKGTDKMKIAMGSDHGGLDLKLKVKKHLEERGFEITDYGTHTHDSVDYPDMAKPVCMAITNGEADCGMLFCGTGIGISIAANKYKGIRAALCSDVYSAKMSKMHNNAQIICMGGRVIGEDLACMIADTWLDTEFEGDRHVKRIEKIHAAENL